MLNTDHFQRCVAASAILTTPAFGAIMRQIGFLFRFHFIPLCEAFAGKLLDNFVLYARHRLWR